MGTLPEWWTGPYPEVSSPRGAIEYLDGLGAALSWTQRDGRWTLSTGDQVLIVADSPAELDSFLLGFALAHLICDRHGPLSSYQAQPAAAQAAPPPPPPAPPPSIEEEAAAAPTAEPDEPEASDEAAASDEADEADGEADEADEAEASDEADEAEASDEVDEVEGPSEPAPAEPGGSDGSAGRGRPTRLRGRGLRR